jgi:hypothetical protein
MKAQKHVQRSMKDSKEERLTEMEGRLWISSCVVTIPKAELFSTRNPRNDRLTAQFALASLRVCAPVRF